MNGLCCYFGRLGVLYCGVLAAEYAGFGLVWRCFCVRNWFLLVWLGVHCRPLFLVVWLAVFCSSRNVSSFGQSLYFSVGVSAPVVAWLSSNLVCLYFYSAPGFLLECGYVCMLRTCCLCCLSWSAVLLHLAFLFHGGSSR